MRYSGNICQLHLKQHDKWYFDFLSFKLNPTQWKYQHFLYTQNLYKTNK